MRPVRDDNQWLWAVPLTEEELKKERAEALKVYDPTDIGGFTCDNCKLAPQCTLAFDPYNTQDDCLYDK